MDQRSARDSRAIEELGYFDPIEPDDSKQLKIDVERAMHWLKVGAQPSDTVRSLLKRVGVNAVPGKPELVNS